MSTPTRPESQAPQGAIVTGGARGIGLGIAQELAGRGYRVVLWDRDFSSFNQDLAGFKPAALTRVDVTDLAAVERAFADALAAAGPIDILVNNAGINGPVARTWEYPVEAWHEVLAVDLTAVFYCSRVAVTHMRARGYGRIVNIASIAGKEGNPTAAAYSSSKAAVIGFTKALGKELAKQSITVNCVTPAAVKTPIFAQVSQQHIDFMLAKIPMGRFGTVEEIAAMVAWLCSEDASFSTGAVFDLSGGRATY
jgi:3-oxoacyl-[acyl-carrier protein] reductase